MRKLAISLLFPFILNTAHAQDNSLLAKRKRLAETSDKALKPFDTRVSLSGDTKVMILKGKKCNNINFLEQMIDGLQEDTDFYLKIDLKRIECVGRYRTILWSAE